MIGSIYLIPIGGRSETRISEFALLLANSFGGQWLLKRASGGLKGETIIQLDQKLARLMNPSAILTVLFSLYTGALASSIGGSFDGAAGTHGTTLNIEKTLAGFNSPKSHGMMMITGPVSHETEPNPLLAFLRYKLRHRRHLKRHHRRHRIHRRRRAQALIIPGMRLRHASPHPKALLEVMKIRERIVVDEQNHPKSAEIALSNDLMQIDPISGQIKMLRHGEIHIKPKQRIIEGGPKGDDLKTGAGLLKSVGPERTFIATEFGADGQPIKMPQEGSRLDRFIRFLHLDQFWPLFFFSVLCGFSFVGLTFLSSKLILGLIDDNERDSYESVPTGDNLLSSIESAQPIKITNEMIEINESSMLNVEKNSDDENN